MLDDPETALAKKRSAEKFPIAPMEEVSANGPGQQRLPDLARNRFRLPRRSSVKKSFGAAVAGLRNHDRQTRLLLIFGDAKIGNPQLSAN